MNPLKYSPSGTVVHSEDVIVIVVYPRFEESKYLL